MSTLQVCIIANMILTLIGAKLIFKDGKGFRKSIYWFIYPDFISIWSKKTWDKDFNESFKMTWFLLFVFVLFWLNIFVYKWFIE